MNLTKGTTWGYLINGTYNGILGDMVKEIVDFSVASFQFKVDRLDVCEYTVQTWLARPCFIFRHPIKNDLFNPFLKPYEAQVWYWIAVFAVLFWLLLYVQVKIENKLYLNTPINTLATHPASEVTLITSSAICQQGT